MHERIHLLSLKIEGTSGFAGMSLPGADGGVQFSAGMIDVRRSRSCEPLQTRCQLRKESSIERQCTSEAVARQAASSWRATATIELSSFLQATCL
jgi:hypothetical protein